MTAEISFTAQEIPVPWARAGARGKRRFTPDKQRKYMARIREHCARAMRGLPILAGPVELKVLAVYPWPTSWSQKRKSSPGAKWKTSTPDADNLVKIIKDALNPVKKGRAIIVPPVIWTDDSQVASAHVWKMYGDAPRVSVTITPLV